MCKGPSGPESGPANPTEPSSLTSLRRRMVSANFLKRLIEAHERHEVIKRPGIRIIGAVFCTEVGLRNVELDRDLVIDRSFVLGTVWLTNVRTSRNISFDGSNIIGSIALRRAKIDGSLFLNRGYFDGIYSSHAKIGAALQIKKSHIFGTALLDGVNVGQNADFSEAKITTLLFRNGRIANELRLSGADIRGRVHLRGTRVGANAFLENLTFGKHAQKNQEIVCQFLESDDKHTTESAKWHLNNRPLYVRNQSLIYRKGHTCFIEYKPHRHELILDQMKIEGDLCINNLYGEIKDEKNEKIQNYITKISLNNINVNTAIFSWNKESGSKYIHDGYICPKNTKTKETNLPRWEMRNFSTKNFAAQLENWPQCTYFDNLEIDSFHGSPKGCDIGFAKDSVQIDTLKNWADSNELSSPQPLAELIDVFEKRGENTVPLNILLEDFKVNQITNEINVPEIGEWTPEWFAIFAQLPGKDIQWLKDFGYICLMWVYKMLVGYGHTPFQIVISISFAVMAFSCLLWVSEANRRRLLLTAIGRHLILRWPLRNIQNAAQTVKRFERLAATASKAGAQKRPVSNGQNFNGFFRCLFYAIDTFVPLVTLRKAHDEFEPSNIIARRYLYFHKFLGYLFTSFLVAGIAGLTP